jgi:hypothetical protein
MWYPKIKRSKRGVMFMWIDTKLGTRYCGQGRLHVMLYRWLRYGIYEKYVWYHWINRSFRYIFLNHIENWVRFTLFHRWNGDGITRRK